MTTFDTAWDLLKIGVSIDPDDFMRDLLDNGRIQEHKGLDRLGAIFADEPAYQKKYRDIILEQMLEPSNQYSLTDAKTPTMYRAETISDYNNPPYAHPQDFRDGRFFTPQRLTAEQYAKYQANNRGEPSQVHQYEMPVGFDDDSVLNVPYDNYGLNIRGGIFDTKSPEIARMAEMNNMSLEEAKKAAGAWNSVYNGFIPRGKEEIRSVTAPIQDAGYDYIAWPETASAAFYPPTVGSAFGSIDWGAPHEAKYSRKDVDKWWDPTRKLMMEQLGIPFSDSDQQAMGKHSGFPQWGAWHIGDEDSAPTWVQNDGTPRNLDRKYQKVDYPNFGAAAHIAEKDLGITGKRWDKR
jgi:hypothetical protein